MPLRAALLSVFLIAGVLAGFLLSGRCVERTGEELGSYLSGYLTNAAALSPSWQSAAGTLWCYLRASLAAFLLGFSSIGLVALPILCAAQGFVLSFSLFCFAGALGREGFRLLPVLFGLRLLIVLPCTLFLASAAIERSRASAPPGGGRRAKDAGVGSYCYRFALCCVCLFLGAALELWLVPKLLAALA